MKRSTLVLSAALIVLMGASGCQTLQQISALKSVDFAIDRVNQVNLAGVNLDNIRTYGDLNIMDATRLIAAVSRGELPLSLTVNLAATNPADNPVTARMVGMDWKLLLDENETISGNFNDPRDLPPGVRVGIPIQVELNLVQFFERSAQDLFELVTAISGDRGAPKRISLRARPTISTPIGPIRYPNEITIISREVGG
ncbi:MAG: hypothetical protein ACI9W4_001705 [Rhodothermales bacterium]|jgi:hypothetical protein